MPQKDQGPPPDLKRFPRDIEVDERASTRPPSVDYAKKTAERSGDTRTASQLRSIEERGNPVRRMSNQADDLARETNAYFKKWARSSNSRSKGRKRSRSR